MLSIFIIIIVFCLYMGAMFVLALKTERGSPLLRRWSEHPFMHACALGIYCTTWTYYGSVGNAATSGLLFLTFYLGPTMVIFLWPVILRKMVRIKHNYRITSIADFISARYSKSQALAAMVTVIALVGVIPYVSLQLRATFNTFKILAMHSYQGDIFIWEQYMAWLIIGLMIIFTILFGARRLDPTETHKGMILSVAVQSLVQLAALLCVGVFVTFFIFHGFDDIFTRLASSQFSEMIFVGGKDQGNYLVWATYLVLSMSAFMFLPRQFHVAVVENSEEKNIGMILWVFPLYMLLINIFLVPIAAGGLLSGLPVAEADSFVLRLPLFYNNFWLAVIVFLGGISAATSMIMISSMTVATMVTNHILLPVLNFSPRLDFLKKHLLKFRWLFIAFFILSGYHFEKLLKQSYMLVNIGLISFAAVLQFAPIIIGALYWRRANRRGALMGLIGGFLLWFYTLLFPAIIKSGWGSPAILVKGPWAITWLRPEQLIGINIPDNMVHAVFWSLFVNITLFVSGSLSRANTAMEERGADIFVDALKMSSSPSLVSEWLEDRRIELSHKLDLLMKVLEKYFDKRTAEAMVNECLDKNHIDVHNKISVIQLAELQNELEKTLSGSLGSASAHQVINSVSLFTESESRELSRVYAKILSDLKLSPEELISKIDYHREREKLISQHAAELEETIRELDHEIHVRSLTEKALVESEYKYRILVENLPQRIFRKNLDGVYTYCNDVFAADLQIMRQEIVGKTDYDFFPFHVAERYREDDLKVTDAGETLDLEEKYLLKGKEKWVYTIKSPIKDEEGQVIGLLGIFSDITDKKKAQEQLNQSKQELEVRVKERTIELIEANKQLHHKISELETTKSELEDAYIHLKETKDQLFQVEKLASIGQLAAGVAHEINNPIGFIKNNISMFSEYWKLLQKYIDEIRRFMRSARKSPQEQRQWMEELEAELNIEYIEKDLPSLLQESQEGTRRIQKIITDLKSFARKETDEEFKEEDLNKIVEVAITIVNNEIKNKCELTKELAGLPLIHCNAQKISQVIINLLINASQAMKERGAIHIETYAEEGYVCLKITDNGEGMSRQVIKKMFDPFFTTKEVGEGTGLGLSISFDIIKKHKGSIEVQSEVGKGTTFLIKFPVAHNP